MNKRQCTRLLNVARALREYAHPERFDMGTYIHTKDYLVATGRSNHLDWCGTPGCALGTYACRPDLQRVLRVSTRLMYNDGGNLVPGPCMKLVSDNSLASYDDSDILEHFGLTEEEATKLFDYNGCGEASTPTEAAEYIEKFVARKLLNQEPVGVVLKRVMGYTPFGK
jgi:hypothetical protein